MSGRKDTSYRVESNDSSVGGDAILALLSIPIGAGILAYYAGKTIIKGGVIVGSTLAKGGYTAGKTAIMGGIVAGETLAKGSYVAGKTAVKGSYVVGKTAVKGGVIAGKTAVKGGIVAGAALAKGSYVVGKTAIKGGIAAVEKTEAAVKTYQEYQLQQEIKRQRMLEERLQIEIGELQRLIEPFSAILNKIANQSLLKDFNYSEDQRLLAMLRDENYNQTLNYVIEIKQKIQRRIQALQEQNNECQKIQPQIQMLNKQIDEMTSLFDKEPKVTNSSWIKQLEQFRTNLREVTLNSFYSLQNRWSNWKLDVTAQLQSLEIQTKVQLELEALRHKIPCSAEEAEKIDPTGYAQLQKLEQHILNQTGVLQTFNLQTILQDYRSAMTHHLSIVVPALEKLQEQKEQQQAVNQKYEPQVTELENLLELAQNEIVKRWAEADLVFLRNSLENLKTCCQEGNASNIERNLENWRTQYETMLTSAGLKQRAEERREYIIQSMKAVLPELGFNIQSIQSESDAKSNTILKVVPCDNSGNLGRRRITISIPQEENEIVQYRFEGYNIEKSREKGQPIEKNDDGKKTVQDIAKSLRPFGIQASEPDWKGNPDKIQKGAKNLPDSSGPEEEISWQPAETKQMEMDW